MAAATRGLQLESTQGSDFAVCVTLMEDGLASPPRETRAIESGRRGTLVPDHRQLWPAPPTPPPQMSPFADAGDGAKFQAPFRHDHPLFASLPHCRIGSMCCCVPPLS